MILKVAVCAGHGGNNSTPGKRSPDGEYEWDFNNIVVSAFIDELNLYNDVEIQRMDDVTGQKDIPLSVRASNANQWGADVYLSFHHNANTGEWGDWSGVESYIHPAAGSQTAKLAEAIQPVVVQAYGLKNRGVKKADYQILRETNMTAVLIEGGFMDSTIDIWVLRNTHKMKGIGMQIASALAEYYSLEPSIMTYILNGEIMVDSMPTGIKFKDAVLNGTTRIIVR